jgi:hypothetical protein
MKRIVLTGALVLSAGAAATATPAQHWNFRVLLDGRPIGEHRFTLSETHGERELRSEARFDVTVLGISLYRYRHEAVERWAGGCLASLAARTETNGTREEVHARTRGDRLVVEAGAGSRRHAGCVMSFAYWNPQILGARELLNAQTGELQPVRVTPQAIESLSVLGRPRTAQRHRIEGGPQLRIDLWYAGVEWVALEAEAPGGRRLRYERIES